MMKVHVVAGILCCGCFGGGVWFGYTMEQAVPPVAQALPLPNDTPHRLGAIETAPFCPPAPRSVVVQPTGTVADSLEQALSADGDDSSSAAVWLRLRAQFGTDQALRLELMQRFEQERDGAKRRRLGTLLQGLPGPDVGAFALRLLSGNDALMRRDAIGLLQGPQGATPGARSVLLRILGNEQNTDVLSAAIGALQPALATPQEISEALAILQKLARHPSPEIRAGSLQALSNWDRSGTMENSFLLALNDSDTVVRQLAINSLAESAIRSDQVKHVLMAMVQNQAEDVQIKNAARSSLQRFPLTSDELLALNRIEQ